MVTENGSLLEVKDLRLYFKTRGGIVQAVDKVDFSLKRTHATVIIGESGCGKSSMARAILRLLPRNIDTYDGQVLLDDNIHSNGHGCRRYGRCGGDRTGARRRPRQRGRPAL